LIDQAVTWIMRRVSFPHTFYLDDADSPADVIDAMALAEFAEGAQPFARTVRLERVRADALLLPAEATVRRAAKDEGSSSHLAGGEGWTLRAVRYRGGSAVVTVTATTADLARTVIEESTKDVQEPEEAPKDAVDIAFTHLTPHGPRRAVRNISTTPWAELRKNYAGQVQERFDDLMTRTPENLDGRLLLLHGPPGTGKTTALRSLAREWRKWCKIDCIIDPEALFSNPAYLMSMAVGVEDDDEEDGPQWRMLLLEDCDELIRGEAKQSTGQALSRLLNLTDGMLGQGRKVLVAITTNEDLTRLHPAVMRPGRCLAHIEVTALPYAEATAWLGTSTGVPSGGATLAELYALRSGTSAPVSTADDRVGLYL
jgi:hypothetical protein